MRTYAVIAALMMLASSAILATEEPSSTGISNEEAYVLLDQLLSLDSQPGDHLHQLERFKRWESLFVRYYRKSNLDLEEMKIYLFMAFVAEKSVAVHTIEEISRNILPKFRTQPDVYLDVLKALPFLTESSCRAISRSFGRKAEQKAEFVEQYGATIAEALGDRYGAECLEDIQEGH